MEVGTDSLPLVSAVEDKGEGEGYAWVSRTSYNSCKRRRSQEVNNVQSLGVIIDPHGPQELHQEHPGNVVDLVEQRSLLECRYALLELR